MAQAASSADAGVADSTSLRRAFVEGVPWQIYDQPDTVSADDVVFGVTDVPIEIMMEVPVEDLGLLDLEWLPRLRDIHSAAMGLSYALTGPRTVQVLLAQLLRGGMLENALTEFMAEIINSSFLNAEPDFGVPAMKEDIRNIPIITISQEHLTDESLSADMRTCAICQELFHTGASVMQLPCRHLFCTSCLRPWLERSRTCPLCREEIVDVRPLPNQSAAARDKLDPAKLSPGPVSVGAGDPLRPDGSSRQETNAPLQSPWSASRRFAAPSQYPSPAAIASIRAPGPGMEAFPQYTPPQPSGSLMPVPHEAGAGAYGTPGMWLPQHASGQYWPPRHTVSPAPQMAAYAGLNQVSHRSDFQVPSVLGNYSSYRVPAAVHHGMPQPAAYSTASMTGLYSQQGLPQGWSDARYL